MRVVSLVPSVTETLIVWGVDVVACTRFCEQPDLVHVGGTKDPDLAAIISLRPDLVVMDVEENRREDFDALTNAGTAVHATHVTTLPGLGEQLQQLALAVGSSMSAAALDEGRPVWSRAVVLIWRRPWMALGSDTYGSSVLHHLGVVNACPSTDRYPEVDLDEVITWAPDLVLLPTEPYPFAERHCNELVAALGVPVRVIDGQDLLWWGARTPGALDRIAAAMADLREAR